MNRKHLVIFFLLLARASFAQQQKVVIRFMDELKGAPLSKVTVVNPAGKLIARVDSAGYAVVPLEAFTASLIALCPGYKPDTLHSGGGTVYMRPLSATLEEAVVRNTAIYRLLNESNEYVADYDFYGDDILVASFSGSGGGNGKLFLVNRNGEIQARVKPEENPVTLYKSCVGVHYCICSRQFYPLEIKAGKISFQQPHDIKLLDGLKECEYAIKGNLYYRLSDRIHFRTQYGIIRGGTGKFRPFTSFREDDVARASFAEWMDIQALLASGQFGDAARRQLNRLKWDNGSFAHINLPLMACNDTLVVFDFFNRKLLFFNLEGDAIGTVPIRFKWRQSQQFAILQDDVTGRVYVHRYDNKGAQTIEELDINRGETLPGKAAVGRPFAENVKVHNGDVYFLWQDTHSMATRQLFIQRTNLAISAR